MSRESYPDSRAYAAGEVTLPFAYAAKASDAPRPAGLDFPTVHNPDNCQVFVRIEDELWQFRCPWIAGKAALLRYRGPDVDHLRQVENGSYPGGHVPCWFLGGMWYDGAGQKLYAPMHIEQAGIHRRHPVARWSSRKIILATSVDKGVSWNYEGDIVTPATYYFNRDGYKFSGSCHGNGFADYGFYADERGGYFYLFPEESWYPKGKTGAFWNVRAARCAIADRMAPGAWRFFHEGRWDEPALGGKSSTVAPSHLWGVLYSTWLGKYIGFFPANSDPVAPQNIDGVGIGVCSDLSLQDWTWGLCPEVPFGFMTLTNDRGDDVIACGQHLRHYSYGAGNSFQRTDITLQRGETRTLSLPAWYSFDPHPESSDPVQSRRTRIVASEHPDVGYRGGWSRRSSADAFEGRYRECGEKGARIEFAFTGSDLYWRALQSPSSGKAEVLVDGVRRAIVDCYSPRSTSFAKMACRLTGLAPGVEHTAAIVVLGEKHPGSAGAAIGHTAFEHAAESYRASAGFSSVSGKNCWYYRERRDGRFADLRFDENDLVMEIAWRGRGRCAIGSAFQVPDEADAVRAWEAPHPGRVRIEGQPSITTGPGGGLEAEILRNDRPIWPKRAVAWGQPDEAHDLVVDVTQNDTISFVASRPRASSDIDALNWDPVITYVDGSPATGDRPTPTGANLALRAAARSKVLLCSYRPFDAVDGCVDTGFVIHADDPLSSGDDWLALDLEWPRRIDRYVVVSQPGDPAFLPGRFTLQASDDGFTWIDVDSVSGNRSPRVERRVAEFRARHVRLYLPDGKPFRVDELELYRDGIPGG